MPRRNGRGRTDVGTDMRIEIWSDVVCPWCYIGKRRLEKALAGFAHRDQVEIVWRSFQLDPSAPTTPVETVAQALGRKYGGGEAAGRDMIDRVEAVAAEEGMVWRHHSSQRVGTIDAHRLLHLALEAGGPALQGALKEALLHAYFVDAENVADHGVLRRIALGAGLDADRVDAVLAGRDFEAEVEADIAQAAAFGATGVPFYVVDRKYGVSGAQPVELFAQVLEKAWSESHPLLETVGGGSDACGPDGCAI
jgi:predicted DsbA family dithiol-disulfide isomerase